MSSCSISPPSPTAAIPGDVLPHLRLVVHEGEPDCETMLARAAAVVPARDVVDWLLLKDVVVYTWHIRKPGRWSAFPHCEIGTTLESFLSAELDWPMSRTAAGELVSLYLAGDEAAMVRVHALLAEAELSLMDVYNRGWCWKMRSRRVEEQNARDRARRDAALEDFEERHPALRGLTKPAIERIVDAALEEVAEAAALKRREE